MKSLAELAPERAQRERLGRVLDAFGHDHDPERVSESDDRAHDRGAGAVEAEAGDEAGVDLQLVDRQRGDVGERRVTRFRSRRARPVRRAG